MSIEELFLEAEADIKNNSHVEAFRKYETILYDEPHHAPSHNSLGWLYKTQFDDYLKAENHFKAAIKSEPLYPHPYFHYAVLLTDMERYNELKNHLGRCLNIPTIEKSWVYYRFAVMAELNINFEEAVSCLERACIVSLSDDKIKDYQKDIERNLRKVELSANHADWINSVKK